MNYIMHEHIKDKNKKEVYTYMYNKKICKR